MLAVFRELLEEGLIGFFARILFRVTKGRSIEIIPIIILESLECFNQVPLQHVQWQISHNSLNDITIMLDFTTLEQTQHKNQHLILQPTNHPRR